MERIVKSIGCVSYSLVTAESCVKMLFFAFFFSFSPQPRLTCVKYDIERRKRSERLMQALLFVVGFGEGWV